MGRNTGTRQDPNKDPDLHAQLQVWIQQNTQEHSHWNLTVVPLDESAQYRQHLILFHQHQPDSVFSWVETLDGKMFAYWVKGKLQTQYLDLSGQETWDITEIMYKLATMELNKPE